MAHYAFLDSNNIVTEVIVGIDETETIESLDEWITQTDLDGTDVGGSSEAWETWYGNFRGQLCKRTSYNANIRKNYASIGDTYDATRDAFIAPKPDNATGFNEETCRWIVPHEAVPE